MSDLATLETKIQLWLSFGWVICDVAPYRRDPTLRQADLPLRQTDDPGHDPQFRLTRAWPARR